MSIFKIGVGHDMRLWPMLSLLSIVVLVPTACLLWFMDRAIENERLAMRKTLEDAYLRELYRYSNSARRSSGRIELRH